MSLSVLLPLCFVLPNLALKHRSNKQALVGVLFVLVGMLASSTTMQAQCTPQILSNNSIPPTSFYGSLTVSIGTNQFCSPTPIYFTVDGSTPSSSSPLYTGPFMITQTTTVKATYGSPLAVETGVYTLLPSPAGSGPGFVPGRVQLNGGAMLDGSNLMLTSSTIANEASSAFTPTPVNVKAFTNDFTYFINNGNADGFMFVVQNQGPSALGAYGVDLGYGPGTGTSGIGKSVGVKFDIYNNAGEGGSSIGLYTNGARPTLPAISTYDQTGGSSGLALSGYAGYRHVHMVYDGTTLTVSIKDETLLDSFGFNFTFSFTYSFPVDIPAVVGGGTAYVGFTGGTGGLKSNQEIILWNYQAGTPVAAPTFSLPGSPFYSPTVQTYNGPQTVALASTTPGATIYYTLNQSVPTTNSLVYTSPLTITSASSTGPYPFEQTGIDIRAIAVLNGVASEESDVVYQIDPGLINDSAGITAGDLALNGAAQVTSNRLHLTDGGPSEAGSAWSINQVGTHAFTTDFTFLLAYPGCCGIAFVTQNQGLNALGVSGFEQGFRPIAPASGLEFALSDTTGKVMNATRFVYGDRSAISPVYREFTQSGVDLHSGHPLHVHLTFDGNTVIYRTTDTTTKASMVQVYAPTVPGSSGGYATFLGGGGLYGSDLAYVGFTGSTDVNGVAMQDILDWTFTAGTPITAPVLLPAPGTYHTFTVTLADTTPGAQIYYTLDGSEPTASSTAYGGPITIGNGKTTVTAVAIVNGVASQQTVGTYTSSLISIDQSAGFATGSLRLNGSATLNGSALQLTTTGFVNQAASAFVPTPVNVQTFMTDFDFQLTNPSADGFMFVVQGQGPTALGGYGVNLGFGGSTPITKSVGIKFDLYSNLTEGTDSTGMYLNGAQPTLPSIDLTPYAVLLNSGRVLHAHLVYNGSVLAVTLSDAATQATATQYYTVNIPTIVGGNAAYVGFTGGTGGLTATQQILDWSYSAP